jgi:hypothetical protein
LSESDTQLPRDGQTRELGDATRAEGREYVLPANAPRAPGAVNGQAQLATDDAQRAARDASAIWRELFAAPSSSQILKRVLDGDPLGIEERCRARIEHLALLVDLERVVQCTMANVAFFAPRYRGAPPFELWLRQRVEAGLERVLEDEQESERALMAFAPP